MLPNRQTGGDPEIYKTQSLGQWNAARRLPSYTPWSSAAAGASIVNNDKFLNDPDKAASPTSESYYDQNLAWNKLSIADKDGVWEDPNYDKAYSPDPQKFQSGRLLVVEDAPRSLSLLVAFYRFFGFSFTGVVLETENDNDDDDALRQPHNDLDRPVHPSKFHPERYLFVLINIAASMICIYMLMNSSRSNLPLESSLVPKNGNDTQMIKRIMENDKDSFIDWKAIETLANKLTDDSRDIEMTKLKPIIRKIIESLTYVFQFDTCLNFVYNLLLGGHLVMKISRIKNIRQLDRSNKLAKRLFLRTISVILVTNLIVTLFCNPGIVSFVYNAALKLVKTSPQNETIAQSSENADNNQIEMTFVMIAMRYLLHLSQFINLTLFPNLFMYSMLMFKRNLQKIERSVTKVKELKETSVGELKESLIELNDQFKSVVGHFSIPLTICFASSTFMVIGSVCSIMIAQGQNQSVLTFIGNIGLLAFGRLVLLSYAGNVSINACRRLIRTIYEHLHAWQLNEWICFMEMKQLRKEFNVSVFSTYRIRQTSVLAMLGFALNYIVILLQTESSIDTPVPTNTGIMAIVPVQ